MNTAAGAGNLARLRTLLQADECAIGDTADTAVEAALQRDRVECLRLLLQHAKPTPRRATHLLRLARSSVAAAALQRHGAEAAAAAARLAELSTAELRVAAARGDATAVGVALGAGADVNGRWPNGSRRSALHEAARSGSAESCAALLKAGADVGLRDANTNTALDLVVDPAQVAVFVRAGASLAGAKGLGGHARALETAALRERMNAAQQKVLVEYCQDYEGTAVYLHRNRSAYRALAAAGVTAEATPLGLWQSTQGPLGS